MKDCVLIDPKGIDFGKNIKPKGTFTIILEKVNWFFCYDVVYRKQTKYYLDINTDGNTLHLLFKVEEYRGVVYGNLHSYFNYGEIKYDED